MLENKKRTGIPSFLHINDASFLALAKACGQLDKQVVIVGLIALKGSLVANGLTTLIASVNDDKALLGVGESLYGTKDSLTLVGSVTGINIYVKRAEAEGTVIS